MTFSTSPPATFMLPAAPDCALANGSIMNSQASCLRQAGGGSRYGWERQGKGSDACAPLPFL